MGQRQSRIRKRHSKDEGVEGRPAPAAFQGVLDVAGAGGSGHVRERQHQHAPVDDEDARERVEVQCGQVVGAHGRLRGSRRGNQTHTQNGHDGGNSP